MKETSLELTHYEKHYFTDNNQIDRVLYHSKQDSFELAKRKSHKDASNQMLNYEEYLVEMDEGVIFYVSLFQDFDVSPIVFDLKVRSYSSLSNFKSTVLFEGDNKELFNFVFGWK